MQMITNSHSVNSAAHYSPAVIHENIVYISGQLPINYAEGQTVPHGGIEEQAGQVFQNLAALLELCGSSREKVLKTTVYIPDISYWPIINRIYADFFGSHKPARTIVPTNTLHYNALIELEAIAYL